MSLVVVGIHERDAPLDLLGRIAVSDHDLPKVLAELCQSPNLDEAVVVSTCMRTEVYAVVERFHDGIADIHDLFEARAVGSVADGRTLSERLLVEYDDAAARHLFEVASGIDSAVLGEGEILRQVRRAAEHARRERATGPTLDTLFRHAVEVGKRARSETAIARGITSLAHVAVAVATDACGGSLAGRRIVVVGAGEMGAGVVAALRDATAARSVTATSEIVIANRSRSRADLLAAQVGGRGIGLRDLLAEVARADVVLTATAGDDVILGAAAMTQLVARRAGRPLVIVDAGMPRDVDPDVGALAGVTLSNLEDLRRYVESEMAARRGEVTRVTEIIDDELDRYHAIARSRSAAPVVAALRAHAEALRSAELEHFRSRLDRLDDDGRALVELVTRRLVQKLLHEPTVQLKGAAGTSRGERLSETLRSLFDL